MFKGKRRIPPAVYYTFGGRGKADPDGRRGRIGWTKADDGRTMGGQEGGYSDISIQWSQEAAGTSTLDQVFSQT